MITIIKRKKPIGIEPKVTYTVGNLPTYNEFIKVYDAQLMRVTPKQHFKYPPICYDWSRKQKGYMSINYYALKPLL